MRYFVTAVLVAGFGFGQLGYGQITLNNGDIFNVGAATPVVTANALAHYGYHINNDNLALNLHGNSGMLGGGDPTKFSNFFGQAELTLGPGNRGLDFNNDADFTATGAIAQADNYSNLFYGSITVTAGNVGNWNFKRIDDDDAMGIWLDLDRDGTFESSVAGLGSNRGEQLQWDNDNGVKTVNLAAGEYRFAVTHREGTGGSGVHVQFQSPTMGSFATIKPGDAAQTGIFSYFVVPDTDLGNITVNGNSTIHMPNGPTGAVAGSLNFANAQNNPSTLTISSATGSQILTVNGATTLGGVGATFNVTNSLTVLNGTVGGPGGLTLSGNGVLRLAGNNTYNGPTTINGGTLEVTNGGALGNQVNGTTVASGGQLRLKGGAVIPAGEAISINGSFGGGAIYNESGDNSILGPVTTTGNTTLRVVSNSLSVNGGVAVNNDLITNVDAGQNLNIGNSPLTGAGTIYSDGDGSTNITVNNPGYTGRIEIRNGVIDVSANNALGTGNVTIVQGDATLRLRGDINIAETIQLTNADNGGLGEANQGRIRNASGSNQISGTVAVNNSSTISVDAASTLTVSGQVSGAASSIITKAGDGRLILANAANNFSGPIEITGGVLQVNSESALGTTAGATTVKGGGTLELQGVSLTGETINLIGGGTLASGNGTANINTPINLSTGTLAATSAGDVLNVNAAINININGDLTLGGAGTVNLNTSFGSGTTPVTINGLQAFAYDTTQFNGNGDRQQAAVNTGAASSSAGLFALPHLSRVIIDATDRIDYNGDANFIAGTSTSQGFQYSLDRLPGLSQVDNYAAMFTGKLNVPDLGTGGAPYDVIFANARRDDVGMIFVDLNRNGVFDHGSGFGFNPADGGPFGELILNHESSGAGLSRTVQLTPGLSYDFMAIHVEFGGGSGFLPQIDLTPDPTGLRTIVPGQMSGLFTTEITPSTSLTKTGTGTAFLNVANTHNGVNDIQAGTLVAAVAGALGNSTNATTIADGATLALSGGHAIANPITASGNGAAGQSGAIANLSGDNTINANISTVPADSGSLGIGSDSGTLTINGDIDLVYSKLNLGGAGDVVINGVISGSGSGPVELAVPNVLNAYAYDVTGNNGDNRLNDVGNNGAGNILNQAAISRILIDGTDSINYQGDADFNTGNTTRFAQGFNLSLDGLPGLNQIDNFATRFEGQINIPDLNGGTPYTVEFGTRRGDDPVVIYLDLDQDGIFEAPAGNGTGFTPGVNERLTSGTGARFSEFAIAPGTYNYLALHLERSGGSGVEPTIDLRLDGLGRRTVQPGVMNGLFQITETIASDNSLVKNGTGRTILTGANTYDGATTVNAGILQVGTGGTSGSIADTSMITVNSGASLVYNRSDDVALAAPLAGAGRVVQDGAATLTIANPANTFTGSYDVNAGTVLIAANIGMPSAIRIASAASFDVAAAALTGGQLIFSSPVTISGHGTLNLDGGSGALVWNNQVSLNPGSSPGNMPIFGNVVAAPAGVYNWELLDVNAGPGVGYDTVTISGDLDITGLGTGASRGIINVFGIDGSSSPALPAGLDLSVKGATSPFFQILSAGSITGIFDPDHFLINAGNLASVGFFTLSQQGNALFLQFTSTVPEPSTYALLALLLAAAFCCHHRRSQA